MSGDMDTSLGNIVLACAMIFSFITMWRRRGVRVEVVDDGDDFVLFCERRHGKDVEASVWQYFLQFGMEVDTEPIVDVFERINFCSAQPVWTTSGYKMVRIFPTCLAKDTFSLVPDFKHSLSVLKSIGVGGKAAWGDVPIACAFYDRLSKIDVRAAYAPLSGFVWLSRGMTSAGSVDVRSRVSFDLAFGIPPCHQIAIEEMIAAQPTPCLGSEFLFTDPINFSSGILPF